MESNAAQERQQAHAYLDHLPDVQVAAVRGLLEAMLDPISRALANAPIDDELATEEEESAVAEAREWLKHNPGIPFEQAVAELGFTIHLRSVSGLATGVFDSKTTATTLKFSESAIGATHTVDLTARQRPRVRTADGAGTGLS